LDTSAYSAFFRGDERLKPWFTTDIKIFVPLIALGELRAGFALGSRRLENEKSLYRFLQSPNVEVLSLTAKTTVTFSSLYACVRKSGVSVSSDDLWIAALAKEHSLPILTLDEDFKRIDGITVLEI
jgi:tRNA(fMet)-specific endonuclease VapC